MHHNTILLVARKFFVNKETTKLFITFVSIDHVRSTAGLSMDGIQVTATERIFLSLLCPLPNEQDFAINVCSLLAMESRKPFPLHHCPRIVDALLAHAGIFSQGKNSRKLNIDFSYKT